MLDNRSLTVQFAAVFLIALALVGGAFYLLLDRIYVNQLKSQAETVADNVEAFGSWVAQYGRVWVKGDKRSYLGHLNVMQAQEGPDGEQPKLVPVDFYSKNPALAQREFSEVVEQSPSAAKFRLTSHNVMNPNNAADEFEAAALERIRGEGLKEFVELTPTGLRYARAVYDKAACIACHGDPGKAPEDVKTRYGVEHGFGFKEGDVAGIVSVRVPAQPFWDVTRRVVGVWQLLLIATAFLVALLFIQFAVVRRIHRLTEATHLISLGKPADLGVARIKSDSRNELHQLALATERLRVSINLAIARLKQRK
jgi:HAMP domain-containing protein